MKAVRERSMTNGSSGSGTNADASGSSHQNTRSEAQKDRVQLACLYCRHRRVKCDGGKPSCSFCVHMGREHQCVYAKVSEEENHNLRKRKRELRARRAAERLREQQEQKQREQQPHMNELPTMSSSLPTISEYHASGGLRALSSPAIDSDPAKARRRASMTARRVSSSFDSSLYPTHFGNPPVRHNSMSSSSSSGIGGEDVAAHQFHPHHQQPQHADLSGSAHRQSFHMPLGQAHTAVEQQLSGLPMELSASLSPQFLAFVQQQPPMPSGEAYAPPIDRQQQQGLAIMGAQDVASTVGFMPSSVPTSVSGGYMPGMVQSQTTATVDSNLSDNNGLPAQLYGAEASVFGGAWDAYRNMSIASGQSTATDSISSTPSTTIVSPGFTGMPRNDASSLPGMHDFTIMQATTSSPSLGSPSQVYSMDKMNTNIDQTKAATVSDYFALPEAADLTSETNNWPVPSVNDVLSIPSADIGSTLASNLAAQDVNVSIFDIVPANTSKHSPPLQISLLTMPQGEQEAVKDDGEQASDRATVAAGAEPLPQANSTDDDVASSGVSSGDSLKPDRKAVIDFWRSYLAANQHDRSHLLSAEGAEASASAGQRRSSSAALEGHASPSSDLSHAAAASSTSLPEVHQFLLTGANPFNSVPVMPLAMSLNSLSPPFHATFGARRGSEFPSSLAAAVTASAMANMPHRNSAPEDGVSAHPLQGYSPFTHGS